MLTATRAAWMLSPPQTGGRNLLANPTPTLVLKESGLKMPDTHCPLPARDTCRRFRSEFW